MSTALITDPLSRSELSRLSQLEETLLRNVQSFIEVGQALKEIRDNRYYRATHETFEAYCKERWSMGRAYAYRIIDCSTVVENLSPIGDKVPESESQCRPLASLPPDAQQQVWVASIERAGGEQPTAKIVSATKAELFPTRPADSPAKTDDSEPASTAMSWQEALQAASRKKQITSAQMAEMMGVSLPDVRKAMSAMGKALGYQVERLNEQGLFSVSKTPSDQDSIVEAFGNLSSTEKMALLRKLSADPDVMRIRSEKQTESMRKGDKATALEAASGFITQAGHELHKYQTNFGSHFGWLAKALKTEEGMAEVVSMIGRLDRIASDSVAYSRALNERTANV